MTPLDISTPLRGRRPSWRDHLPERYVLVGYLAVVAVALAATLGAVGIRDEYQAMAGRCISAERRAKIAEDQLALMLVSGDGGVLLANIDTREIGPAQLRLVPRRIVR